MKILFSGIGGSGVSAIAGFMADRGHTVFGSDRLFDRDPGHPLRASLTAQGITLIQQDGKAIDRSFDLAVFSTAVEHDNPEYVKAMELGIPLKTRPEYLAEIVAGFETIAVAGTSGKSTTAGMLAWIMRQLGMEPNFLGGGRVKQFRSAANAGNYIAGKSGMLVVEACESDGTIINYRPSESLILNLDLDHHSIAETGALFAELSRNTSGVVISGGDDRNLAACDLGDVRKFSIDSDSGCRAVDVEYSAFETRFRVQETQYRLALPGKHNLYNALACIAVLSELGVRGADISGVLPQFSGIERRFDIHLNDGRHLVIDDYAHNPHKIAGLMQTMARISGRICYVFQPHGFGPTRLMREGYIRTFAEHLRPDDQLFLLPIYYAGGTAAKDISSEDIAAGVRASGGRARVVSREELSVTPPGRNVYVVFGARDDTLSGLAETIASRLLLR